MGKNRKNQNQEDLNKVVDGINQSQELENLEIENADINKNEELLTDDNDADGTVDYLNAENEGQSSDGQEESQAGEEAEAGEDKPKVDAKAKKLAEEEAYKKQKINRTTAIDKRHIPRTIKRIVREKNKIRFDSTIQRGHVWTQEQKSLFIHSLIYGYPFPPAYAQDKGDGELWMLDGKQRLSCVIDFCTGAFKLHKDTPDAFGVEINGKYFEDLPDDFRSEIENTNFTIYQMVDMTDDERDEMFVRLNKGTALNKMEQTRAMYSTLINQVETIGKMQFFVNDVKLSKSAKNRFTDQELILQTAMLLDEGHTFKGTGGAQIQKYVNALKMKGELISDDVFNKFVKADDYLSTVTNDITLDEIKEIFKKVHVPIIIKTALKAIDNNVEEKVFGDFLVDFLIRNYSQETPYGIASQKSTTKKESVNLRLKEMDRAFVDFVNKRIEQEEDKLKTNHEEVINQAG